MKKNRAIVFDGDDTLWETQFIYEFAKKKFLAILGESKREDQMILRKLEQIDLKNVKKFGLSSKRFPKTLVDTYLWYAWRNKLKPRKEMTDKVKQLGENIFRRKPKLKPSCKRILKKLGETNKLFLVTAGERKIQKWKVDVLGLTSYFNKVFIIKRKNKNEFSKILRKINPSICKRDIWMIGNSIKFDIMPALDNKINAIWIPSKSWGYENASNNAKGFVTLSGLNDLLPFFKKLARDE